MSKLIYCYINPQYLIDNSIFTEKECKQRKIWCDANGKFFGRQFAGVIIYDKQYPMWIPEQTIRTAWQDENINSNKQQFYRYKCDSEHYLCFNDALIVPLKFIQEKVNLSFDKNKLDEIQSNIPLIKNKLSMCVFNIPKFEQMKNIYKKIIEKEDIE